MSCINTAKDIINKHEVADHVLVILSCSHGVKIMTSYLLVTSTPVSNQKQGGQRDDGR